jgi:hypothetical protein
MTTSKSFKIVASRVRTTSASENSCPIDHPIDGVSRVATQRGFGMAHIQGGGVCYLGEFEHEAAQRLVAVERAIVRADAEHGSALAGDEHGRHREETKGCCAERADAVGERAEAAEHKR